MLAAVLQELSASVISRQTRHDQRSAHIFGKLTSAHYVEMEVLDALTSIISAVSDDTIAVFKSGFGGDPRDHLENMCNDLAVFRRYSIDRGDVGLRDYKDVYRGLRVDVVKCEDGVILISLFRWDVSRNNFAENAVHF